MLRRIHIETDDVSSLLLESRIIRGHVAIQPVRLQACLRPHTLHGRLAQPQRLRHLAAGPMRRSIRRLLLCLACDPRLHRRIGNAWLTALVTRIEPRHCLFFEPLLPARDSGSGGAQASHDLGVGRTISQRQNQPRAEDISGGQRARLRPLN
jgi:hypothetical protein